MRHASHGTDGWLGPLHVASRHSSPIPNMTQAKPVKVHMKERSSHLRYSDGSIPGTRKEHI